MTRLAGSHSRAATVLALLLLSAPSRADEPNAQDLIQRGVALRRERHDAEALALFRQAYDKEHATRALAQIGLAELAIARWVEAEEDLQRALADDHDPWVVEHRDGLERSLEVIRGHLARLEIDGNVDGAEVWINGAQAARLPLAAPLRLPSGPLSLEVRASGRPPIRRELDLPADAHWLERIRFDLVDPPPIQAAPAPDLPPAPSPGLRPSTLAWGILAGGGVFLGGGVAGTLYRNDRAAAFDSNCPYGSQSTDSRCGGWQRDIATGQALAVASYSLGGAAVLAAGALFLRARDESARVEARDLVPAGAIAGGLFLVAGVAAHVYRNVEAASFDAHCPNGASSSDSRCGGWNADVATGETLAVVGYSLAGATLLATGLEAWAGRKRAGSGAIGVRCMVTVAQRGLACNGTF